MPQGLPQVIPNQVIESAHINNIADRVVGRFATNAELAAAIPAPVSGQTAAVAGRLYVYRSAAWHTVDQTTRLFGSTVAANPVTAAGQIITTQQNWSMPAIGLVRFSYAISLARVSGTTASNWEAVVEGTAVSNLAVHRMQMLPAPSTGIVLTGTGTAEMPAGAAFGRVTVRRVDGDMVAQSFAGAWGLEIIY